MFRYSCFRYSYDAGGNILQSTTGANTSSYLHGLNQIGEFGAQTMYYLIDGVGSVRQVVETKNESNRPLVAHSGRF